MCIKAIRKYRFGRTVRPIGVSIHGNQNNYACWQFLLRENIKVFKTALEGSFEKISA